MLLITVKKMQIDLGPKQRIASIHETDGDLSILNYVMGEYFLAREDM